MSDASAAAIMKRAFETYRRDRRVAMLVDSSVATARGKLGRYINPENADEEAMNIARTACAILAERIFTEDAELHALRMERDHYKKIAEEALLLRPPQPIFVQEK